MSYSTSPTTGSKDQANNPKYFVTHKSGKVIKGARINHIYVQKALNPVRNVKQQTGQAHICKQTI